MRLHRLAATLLAFVACALGGQTALAAPPPPIAFVPLDDRPVTLQLPRMLGAIAGQAVLVPPRATIGSYLEPGQPDAILDWLHGPQGADVAAVVASTDMLAYGGLVASRVPGVSVAQAYGRLRRLAALKAARRSLFVAAFGTIMRLAPTGVPALGAAASYYATGETVDEITAYANLPDPPQTEGERAEAARLRKRLGTVLDRYLQARARNLAVDEWALQLLSDGGFDRLVIGQDDAGPVGLHLRDVAALQRTVRDLGLERVASIEPGADELGMVLLAQTLARTIAWTPTVRVVYSRPDAAQTHDQLEFVPIDVTIAHLIGASGARRVERDPDLTLYVKVADTSENDEAAFERELIAGARAGKSVAVADLTFLRGEPGPNQRELTEALIDAGVAGTIDAFASWNTNANTVGTALAAAIAAGAGRRDGRFDPLVHAQFMLDRYVDDYAFHQFVRPELNEQLRSQCIDTSLLLPPVAAEASARDRALLWPYALDLLAKIYPQYKDAGLTIALPWDRTFETSIDVRLRP